MTTSKEIKLVIGDLCRALCEKPAELKISAVETARNLSLEIVPSPVDVSKIIGKQGANIKAISRIAEAMTHSIGKRIKIDVSSDTEESGFKPYKFNPKYDAREEAALLSELMACVFHDGVTVKVAPLNTKTTALMISGAEHWENELEKDLATVFNAIGRNKGHDLIVEFEDCEVMP